MPLLADLHIHSRFSRATSRELSFPTLHRAALEKGLALVGTGDFTHSGWMAEIREQLEPAEPGLFRLRADLARAAEAGLPAACAGEVRFVLSVEISNIYKQGDRVRKNHNLVLMPSLEAAQRFRATLAAIGNLDSDGRPILGLDARDLLEITLSTDPLAFLIPAHIWTPWFSMLGSKSGFDSVAECFGDLAGEVFAAETGLSSDPPMNWRVSELDRLTLVSNSDAHSLGSLGREANLLDIEPGFAALRRALQGRDGFLGTVEFYPEEGKYHLDGHRACGVRLEPEETRRLGGRCPQCGGVLTVGVLSRVISLADRRSGFRPADAPAFQRLVPLDQTVAQVADGSPSSRRVREEIARLLSLVGPELFVLREAPIDDIARVAGAAVAEAIRRVRCGELSIAAGFDGEFGSVQIFAPAERDALFGQLALPGAPGLSRSPSPVAPPARAWNAGSAPEEDLRPRADAQDSGRAPFGELDAQQRAAVETPGGPLLIVAGPGTGKTRTAVARIAHQVRSRTVRPDQVLALAFTNQAADELSARILREVPGAAAGAPLVTTFHGLGLRLLAGMSGREPRLIGDEQRLELVQRAAGGGIPERVARAILGRISLSKQSCDPWEVLSSDQELLPVIASYQEALDERGVLDVDDLVLRPYQMLATDPPAATRLASRWAVICVDEYQDVNDVQAGLIGLLAPSGAGLCAIGDPDQAIYGFRGARPGHFLRFADTFDGTTVVRLDTSYRLTDQILEAARSVLGGESSLRAPCHGAPVEVVACPTAASEAEQLVVRIERIVGGTSHFAVDSGRASEAEQSGVGFGEIAVLCRTRAQRPPLLEALDRAGIPCRAVGEDEPHDPRSQKVAVMTMHAAKGREFEAVFVTGVEEGLLPLERDGGRSDPEEERRLLYVAMTRARRLLVLSHATHRTLWGVRLPGRPSPLLAALPDTVHRSSPSLPRGEAPSRQLKLF
ncbi:MAG TPA: UvrD-helicase domain-containing protein [Thermoanaerobaculales bacterium]|nr:UvrD-helicase domain-containing protein [Thermoanaerobaculales bacterium]HQN96473.1 UvrD-helicase domain-containing protein [Thermoanaerobaculales bacterium]HQP43975.1 UvrD-helicase domain-containing protein [Thermoanaerobaculales bacterium]